MAARKVPPWHRCRATRLQSPCVSGLLVFRLMGSRKIGRWKYINHQPTIIVIIISNYQSWIVIIIIITDCCKMLRLFYDPNWWKRTTIDNVFHSPVPTLPGEVVGKSRNLLGLFLKCAMLIMGFSIPSFVACKLQVGWWPEITAFRSIQIKTIQCDGPVTCTCP